MSKNTKEYQREWERKNKSKRYAYNRKYRLKMRRWYIEQKGKLSCGECGETHISCLVFHHRDPKTKLFNVSDHSCVTSSKKRILAEITKCDVLCKNCHSKLHYEIRQALVAQSGQSSVLLRQSA